jgi:alkanesulfonate monooxygenase SsuD/methylene tetrahydromethanopterin reductase-like flavin-dependent oxidoreductase (luciferase family)
MYAIPHERSIDPELSLWRNYRSLQEEQDMLMGQQLGSYSPSRHGNHWDTTLAAARACEQAGLDSVWLADHFMFPDKEHPEKEVSVFDCFVALGAIAASTSRIRIGELVVGVPYRNPALLAKMLTTLDAITRSNDVGILIAANQRELAAKKERYGEKLDLIGTPDAIIEGLRRYAQVGSQYLTFHMPDAKDIEPILLLGETVVREVAQF